LYNHYCVIDSKIRISVNHQLQTNMNPFIWVLKLDDDQSVTSTLPDFVAEHPQATSQVVVSPAPGVQPVWKTLTFNTKQFFGRSPLSNSELQGTGTSDPTEQSYFFLVADSYGSANQVNITITAEIEYTAIWKELKDPASS